MKRRCLIHLDPLLLPETNVDAKSGSLARLWRNLRKLKPVLLTEADEPTAKRAVVRACLPEDTEIVCNWTPESGSQVFGDGEAFFVTADAAALKRVVDQPDLSAVVPIGLRVFPCATLAYERAGAWFVARDLDEAAALLLAEPRPESLSVVLMAHNEEYEIANAIADVRRFCRLYWKEYEIVVVDDGSTDGTRAAILASESGAGDLHVIQHHANRGMGASMRDGFLASRCEYITVLPADRQVRPQALATFLPHLAPTRCVHGFYSQPHSGFPRNVMSVAFRQAMRKIAQLHVDFAGLYVFHASWREHVDLRALPSDSFVFSFELLDALRQAKCGFIPVHVDPFLRNSGESRVARPARIMKVFTELVRSRKARQQRG